jgi:hypothetical protein
MSLASPLHVALRCALLASLIVAPACADEPDVVLEPGLEQVVISRASAEPDVRLPDSEPAPPPSPACLCPDDACVRTWIETELGCGLCVLLVCGDDDHRGGCVACPEAP